MILLCPFSRTATVILSVLIVSGPAAFAQAPAVSSFDPLYTYGVPYATPAAPAYEHPGPVQSATLVSASERKGTNFTVAPMADATGMLYSFKINTDYGVFEPQSLQMLRVRVAEFAALSRLEALSKNPQFMRGFSKQLENTVSATGKAIMSPIKTLKQMPVGMKKFAGDIQAQQAVGRVYGESGPAAHSQVKRELAARLGVDPYTDNEPLQALLNDAAKHESRGQLVASLGTLVIGGGAGLALGVVEMNDEFTALIRNKSAAQLQLDNQEALLQLGCSPATVNQFLTTPGYTATNCTAISRAMVTLGSVRGVCGLLENFPPVAGPASVLFNQTQIQMAAQFHRNRSRLTSVRFIGGTAVWADAAGTSYVFSPLEYLYWNEEVDVGLSNLRRSVGSGAMQFWISGTATPTAKAMLESRGVSVREKSLVTLWPAGKKK